jgi:AFG3 family protein
MLGNYSRSVAKNVRVSSVKTVINNNSNVQILKGQQRQYSSFPWFNKLFNNPKGFGKFYPKSGNKPSSSSSSSAAKPQAKTGVNSNAKRGGNSGNNPQSDFPGLPDGGNWKSVAVATMAAATLALVLSSDTKQGREISWQEFQSQLLESGQVDRIIVSNKNIAKVILHKPVGVEDANAPIMNIDYRNQSISADGNSFATSSKDESAWNSTTVESNNNSEDHKFSRYPRLGMPPPSYSQYYFAIGSVESFEKKLENAQKSLNIAPKDYVPVMYVNETNWINEASRFLPTVLLIGAYFFVMRGQAGGMGGGGNVFKIGKSPAKKINKELITTTFVDVAGCDEAKREIMEFVDFLKDSKKFTDLGAKIPKGALLCGPPGTGKTLLARATAGEANVPFYSISGSDFIEMFVGVGPSRVRDLFKEARANAPCIIFIDEIDAVGRQRGKGGAMGGNDERENTLNQLLVEMDGFDSTSNVVLLAGTNRADVLDSALLRPGRFDRQIQVEKPDIAGRTAIFEVHLKGITLLGQPETYSKRLAALTPGFAGADIANICNEAAIMAARKMKSAVDMTDFEMATDRIIGGLESKKIMSLEERRVVAYHEAGHAVAGWNLEHADPLLKVTIVPRGSGALGFAQYLPKEIFLRTRAQILDMVCMALAGRAAEQVYFGKVTTGAADDLRRVTQIVYQMVTVYGMNEKIGQVSFPKEEGQWPQDKLYSNATGEVMDEEVRSIVEEAYKRTLALMEERKEQVKLVAELLLEKETITNMDVTRLIGDRPYSAGKDYDAYVTSGWENGETLDNINNNENNETTPEATTIPAAVII